MSLPVYHAYPDVIEERTEADARGLAAEWRNALEINYGDIGDSVLLLWVSDSPQTSSFVHTTAHEKLPCAYQQGLAHVFLHQNDGVQEVRQA